MEELLIKLRELERLGVEWKIFVKVCLMFDERKRELYELVCRMIEREFMIKKEEGEKLKVSFEFELEC